jgi:hypothetical protein
MVHALLLVARWIAVAHDRWRASLADGSRARLQSYAAWFNEHRPHQGLGNRTPDEVHHGQSTRARSVPLRAALAVAYSDGNHDLPILALRHAA